MKMLTTVLTLALLTPSFAEAPQTDAIDGIALGSPLPPDLEEAPDGELGRPATIAGVPGKVFVDVCEGSVIGVRFIAGAVVDAEVAESTVLRLTTDVRGAVDRDFDTLQQGHLSLGWTVVKEYKKRELERVLEGMGMAERRGIQLEKGDVKRQLVSYCKNYEATSSDWVEAIAQMSTPRACFVRLSTTSGEQCLSGL